MIQIIILIAALSLVLPMYLIKDMERRKQKRRSRFSGENRRKRLEELDEDIDE
jgi:hypothetical protein